MKPETFRNPSGWPPPEAAQARSREEAERTAIAPVLERRRQYRGSRAAVGDRQGDSVPEDKYLRLTPPNRGAT